MKRIIFTCLLSSTLLTNIQAQTTIFTQDFQNGIPLATWTIIINDTSTVDPSVSEFAPGWISLPDPDNPTDTVVGATSYFTVAAQASRWLITPNITIGAYGNILRWEGRSHDPSFPDGYQVLISTTNTDISSFTDTLLTVYPEDEFWTQHEVNLSEAGYVSQTVFIAFVLKTYDAYKLYLDDISVVINDPVGVTELVEADGVLYPNPASTVVSIKGDQPERVKIYSSAGRLVYEQTAVSGQAIDISLLPNGTYIVEMSGEHGISRERLVKI